MSSYIKDKCPVCGSGEYKTLGPVRRENSPVPAANGSAIVKCGKCRLIYVNPMPYWDEEDFKKLYDETYFDFTNADEKWLYVRKNVNPAKRFERIGEVLKSDGKKMLEIGAGEYAFMCRYLIDRGWDATAQEPNKAFAEKLRGIRGLRVETDSVADLKNEKEGYSLIFADSVLEHVPNPVEYYRKLAGLLAPGGVLYTVSPNEYSAYNYLANIVSKLKGRTPHFIAPYEQPYHLIGFTGKSLEILGEKSGLTLVSYKKLNDYKAFIALNSNRGLVKYPLALLFSAAQGLGLGTNGEAMFVKSKMP